MYRKLFFGFVFHSFFLCKEVLGGFYPFIMKNIREKQGNSREK